jgi:Winged helix DNA-binding domain
VLTAAPPAESAELRGPAAIRTLARRYLAAFGPAAAEDITAWSGQPARACATALDSLRGELAEVMVAGQPMWVPLQALDTGPGPGDQWQLLPALDTYLVGYRQRDLLIDPAEAKFIYAGGGWIHPSVVRDGRIVGSWRLRREKAEAGVDVMLFDGSAPRQAIGAVVADLGRFLGMPAGLRRVTGF